MTLGPVSHLIAQAGISRVCTLCTLRMCAQLGSIEYLGCAQAFKLAVGREYRLIDRLDVVPALPPFTGYIQLDFPLWIQVWLLYPCTVVALSCQASSSDNIPLASR